MRIKLRPFFLTTGIFFITKNQINEWLSIDFLFDEHFFNDLDRFFFSCVNELNRLLAPEAYP